MAVKLFVIYVLDELARVCTRCVECEEDICVEYYNDLRDKFVPNQKAYPSKTITTTGMPRKGVCTSLSLSFSL